MHQQQLTHAAAFVEYGGLSLLEKADAGGKQALDKPVGG
jgi:hypothetical protein